MAALAEACRVLVADTATAAAYAEVRARLKRRGQPIPENDVWIAALCIQHSSPLATRDVHFRQVEGLEIVASWGLRPKCRHKR